MQLSPKEQRELQRLIQSGMERDEAFHHLEELRRFDEEDEALHASQSLSDAQREKEDSREIRRGAHYGSDWNND